MDQPPHANDGPSGEDSPHRPTPEALAARADFFFEAGKLELAARSLQEAIQIDPDRPGFHRALGVILDAMGRFDQAANALRLAAEIQARSLGPGPAAADEHPAHPPVEPRPQPDPAHSGAEAEDARLRRLAHIETLIQLGLSEVRSGQYRSAVKTFERFSAWEPDRVEGYRYRIFPLAQLAEFEQSELMFYQAVQVDAHDVLAHDQMAQSMALQGRFEQAANLWRRVEAMNPKLPGLHANLGQACEHLGRDAQAIERYRRHLRHHREDFRMALRLGRLLSRHGRVDEAIVALRRAARPGRRSHASDYQRQVAVQALLLCGELHLSRHARTDARRCFEQAVYLRPDMPGARLGLAMVAAARGDAQSCRAHLLSEVACDGHNGHQIIAMARLMIDFDLRQRAVSLLNVALAAAEDEDPDRPAEPSDAPAAPGTLKDPEQLAEGFFLRGAAALMADDIDEGIDDCRRALRYNPGHALARYNLILAYLGLDEPGRAWAHFRFAVERERQRRRDPEQEALPTPRSPVNEAATEVHTVIEPLRWKIIRQLLVHEFRPLIGWLPGLKRRLRHRRAAGPILASLASIRRMTARRSRHH